jgi:KDO2-lipid IV(A) lauroyltransferase
MTPAKYARWVRVSPEAMAWLQHLSATFDKGVIVSGHLGNWELLLGTRLAFPNSAKITSLFEQTPVPELDVALDSLRGRSGGKGAVRKGGAMALKAALDRGESVGLLVDRNVRQEHGGVWAPFLGLEARTSPLPVVLARRYGLPMGMLLCVPDGPRRWRLWMSPNFMEPPTDDEAADVRRVLTKINDALGAKIREHPEAWLWMIKRWKSRPTEALGRYPAYSYWDPDVRR